MEKAKLTKAQAEALENMKKNIGSVAIIKARCRMPDGKVDNSEYAEVFTIPLDSLIFALFNDDGYDIERTPEEKVLLEYQSAMKTANSSTIYSSVYSANRNYAAGIKFALCTLGIQIEGINKGETK